MAIWINLNLAEATGIHLFGNDEVIFEPGREVKNLGDEIHAVNNEMASLATIGGLRPLPGLPGCTLK